MKIKQNAKKKILKIHNGLIASLEAQAKKEDEIDAFTENCSEVFGELQAPLPSEITFREG